MKNLHLLEQTKKQDGGFTITGLMVTCALVGILAPVIGDLFVNLAKVQAKALNFGEAESTATIYATAAKASKELSEVPDVCELEPLGNEVYTIECTVGEVQGTVARATRTFDIYVETDNESDETDTDEPKVKAGPYTPGVYCPHYDPDGTIGFDNDHNVNCNPGAWWHEG